MDKEEIKKREVDDILPLLFNNHQQSKVFKRVIYELCEINHEYVCLY